MQAKRVSLFRVMFGDSNSSCFSPCPLLVSTMHQTIGLFRVVSWAAHCAGAGREYRKIKRPFPPTARAHPWSPTLHHRVPPPSRTSARRQLPAARAAQSGAGAGRPWGKVRLCHLPGRSRGVATLCWVCGHSPGERTVGASGGRQRVGSRDRCSPHAATTHREDCARPFPLGSARACRS